MIRSIIATFCLIVYGAATEKIYKAPLEPEDHRFDNIAYTQELPFKGFKVIRVTPTNWIQLRTAYDLETRLNITVDYWSRPAKPKYPIDIFLGPIPFNRLKEYFKKKQIEYEVINSNIGSTILNENRKHSTGYNFNPYTGFDYTRYHNYDEIIREVKSLVNRYSRIASLLHIGDTYEGRRQYAVKISVSNQPNRKMFFFNCGIHAREWITPATCMYMLKEMLSKYSNDNEVTRMLQRVDWVIMPVVNADGYAFTWKSSFSRYWRKTRTKSKRPFTTCIGADPNRNFPFKWGGVGTSSNPCRDTYKGEHALSEPCVKNLVNYLQQNKRDLIGYIDVHSYSQLWMTPWGYIKRYPSGYQELSRISKIAVDALQKKYDTKYEYGPSSIIIYETSGSSDDWAYAMLNVRYSFALELRDKGRYGFNLPSRQIIPTGIETFAAFKAMALNMIV